MRIFSTAATALAFSCALSAQFQLTTLPQPWVSNNGGGVGGGVYFDMTVSAGVSITQFDCNFSTAAGTAGSIDVYTINGTYLGNEANQAAWTLAGTANCTAAGRDLPTACVFNSPIVLNPGTYGIAICANGQSHAYTNGTGTNQNYSDPFLALSLGAAGNICFSGTPFTPRVWNGVIYYGPVSGVATATAYGDGCGGTADYASFWERFGPTNAFDLGGSPGNETVLQALNTGGGYAVLSGPPAWFTPTSPDLGLPDDGDSAALPLGFTFTMPGGASTNDVIINSNGYVYLDSINNNPLAFYFQNSVTDFVNYQARIAFCWVDLDPGTGTGAGTIHFDTAPGAAYITFLGVQRFGFPGETIDAQVALFQGGNFEIRYGTETMSAGTGDPFVGYTPGNGALEPPMVDLSSPPIFTNPDLFIPNLTLSSQRPVEGTTMQVNIDSIPPGTALGTLILSATQINPGIQPFPGLGSCVQYVGLNDVFYYFPSGSSQVLNFPVPTGTFTGAAIYAQAVTLSPGVNALGVASSNGLEWVIDVQ